MCIDRSPMKATRCHYQNAYPVRPLCLENRDSLYSEAQSIMDNGHMGPNPSFSLDQQTHMSKNITSLQLFTFILIILFDLSTGKVMPNLTVTNKVVVSLILMSHCSEINRVKQLKERNFSFTYFCIPHFHCKKVIFTINSEEFLSNRSSVTAVYLCMFVMLR